MTEINTPCKTGEGFLGCPCKTGEGFLACSCKTREGFLGCLFTALLLLFTAESVFADEVLLLVQDVSESGLVLEEVDLTKVIGQINRGKAKAGKVKSNNNKFKKSDPLSFLQLQAFTIDAKAVPVQFVPAWNFNAENRIAGTILLKLVPGYNGPVRLHFQDKPAVKNPVPWNGTIRTKDYVVTHDVKKQGGMPSSIEFCPTGKIFNTFRWNDRVYLRDKGSFLLGNDLTGGRVKLISDGPVCKVVRVEARYMQSTSRQPASKPHAVYDWYYFKESPLVFVSAHVMQNAPCAWDELHFLELNFPDKSFKRWIGGTPFKKGDFKANKKSIINSRWGALVDGQNAIAIIRGGTVLLYDGRGSGGTYLHAYGRSAWRGWRDIEKQFSAWLWIGSADNPGDSILHSIKGLPVSAPPLVTIASVHSCIEKAGKTAQSKSGKERRIILERLSLAEKLEQRGEFNSALKVLKGQLPPNWTRIAAGDLLMILKSSKQGVKLESLYDLVSGQELSAGIPVPFFTIYLQNTTTAEKVQLASGSNWKKVDIKKISSGLRILWSKPGFSGAMLKGDLQVDAEVTCNGPANAFSWKLSVDNATKNWTIRRVVFPRLSLAELGKESRLFYPHGPGVVKKGAWREPFNFHGRYPGAWVTMQFLAIYNQKDNTGLYVAMHDPRAATKEITITSQVNNRSLLVSYDHPVEEMGRPGNSFRLSGSAVWRLLRGDWFDAAQIYRLWASKHAHWFPKTGRNGRTDTPLWMKELPAWVLTGGAPSACVPRVKEFARFIGLPVGFHWYNWHKIPFDNDYPHYFPAKDGFRKGVKELEKSGVYVMPYINGRLWDTHDREDKDFQFSSIALPAATKNEKGEPYIEVYGSKEKDGKPVKLAVMCPTTSLWQNKVREIVLRLMEKEGVNGVYIDQIAAASPKLCFDKTHGHPLGGGHWWVDGYAKLLTSIRDAMPSGCMLTTECTAESYARWVDGYLSWNWQYQGQVPAFPAVYSGALQIFGRAYRKGPTAALSLRMKAGQQLVFGEQIGWLNPDILKMKKSVEFLRQVVRLRWKMRRYFYAGRLARPPELPGDIPEVRGDWQWYGETWITCKAVLTGAWQLPGENRLALFFVNVSDKKIQTELTFKGKDYGLKSDWLQVEVKTETGTRERFKMQLTCLKKLNLSACEAIVWEVRGRAQPLKGAQPLKEPDKAEKH